MDATRKERLRDAREDIVKDLEVGFVLRDLEFRGVLGRADVERIKFENNSQEGAKSLLDILESEKDNHAYDQFVDVLKENYGWISDSLKILEDHDDQLFEDAIILGDLPRLPSHYIDRTDMLHSIRKMLRGMKRCGRIVLHGMTGCGKSCLAAAAVQDKHLVKEEFKYQLFWLNLGEVREHEQILKHLQRFAQRLTRNSDSGAVPQLNSNSAEDSIFTMRNYLRNTIASSPTFSKALLILDNICSDKIITSFDIGCRMIVTTQNREHIIEDQNTAFINITSGFTEEETLMLFAKALDSTLEHLKKIPEAKRVSDLCKGQPMLIDLIGTHFKPYREDLLNNGSRWNYYIQNLTRKKELKQIFSAIKFCVNDLNEDLRAKFEDFVVFVEDVNIMPEVLQTLWEIEEIFTVQDVMTEFGNKSLIVSYYNQDKRTYIYGVHDLLLGYLKETLSNSEVQKRHCKLINAYQKKCNGNFADLPNDNYIYQYIGHHLVEAKMLSKFRELYFDLNFIGAKIRATGIADLIRDLEHYEQYIASNVKERDKLQMYRKFIEANGYNLHKYQDLDIIQCGLQQKRDSPIYKDAIVCAMQRPNKLYFELQPTQENHYYMHTLDLTEDLHAACFAETTKEILVGTKTGHINLWEQPYQQKLCTFQGHTGCITYLELSPDKEEFLSVSEDGTVKLWKLTYAINRNSNGILNSENNVELASPRLKQLDHQAFFSHNSIIDRSRTFKCHDNEQNDRLISASFSRDFKPSKRIVTGSQKGRVVVRDINNLQSFIEMKMTRESQPATCVSFSYNDELVIVARGQNIFLYSSNKGEFISKFNNRHVIKSLLVVPDQDHSLIAVNDNCITMWTWTMGEGLCVTDPEMRELCSGNGANFICGAVTEDGAYLVAASTDRYTRMWNLETHKLVDRFHNKNGQVISLDAFYEDDNNSVHILLTGSDDRTVKQLHVFPEIIDKKETKNIDVFDAYCDEKSFITAIANTNNTIQIKGRNIANETSILSGKIKFISFSGDGNNVAYALDTGQVQIFDCETSKTIDLNFNAPVVKLKCFDDILTIISGDGFLVCYSLNDTFKGFYSTYCSTHVPIESIVQIFYIRSIHELILVYENHVVVAVRLSDSSTRNLLVKTNVVVTSSAISSDNSMLVLTMSNGSFEVYSLQTENGFVVADYSLTKHLGGSFSTCAISFDKKYLALGRVNGQIEIWNLEMKALYTTLSLHKDSVRHLSFLPGLDSILVSVCDQIAWWDINKVPIEAQNKSRSFRRRSNSIKRISNLSLSLETNVMKQEWILKSGLVKKPHLLSTIKFHGVYANTVYYSRDLTSFFTVDNNGESYLMELLKST